MAGESPGVVALKGANLLTNISDLILDQRLYGYRHWEQVFKSRDRAECKVSHYLRLADILIERLAHYEAYPIIAAHLRERSGELRKLFENWAQWSSQFSWAGNASE